MRYLSEDITKQELAEQWPSPEIENRKQKFLEGITDLENKMRRYNEVLDNIYLLMRGYVYLRHVKPVIINDSSVHDLELMKKGLTVKLIRDHVTEGSINWHIIYTFEKVLREGPIKVFETTVMKPLQDVRQELKAFEMNLRDYQDSIKMDS